MAVLAETMSITMDLLSMVSRELATFAMAVVGYILFSVGLPLFMAPEKAMKKMVGYILFSGGLPLFMAPEKAVKKMAEESKGQSPSPKL